MGVRGGSVVTWWRRHCECHGGLFCVSCDPWGVALGVPVGFLRCAPLVAALVSCGYCDSCRVNVLLLALVGVWRCCCVRCPCGACVLMGCGAMASLVLAAT